MQPLEPEDPRSVGAYRLVRRLGAGGMGRVYLGRSPGGRTVAVKMVHPHVAADEGFRARFRREVEAARRVGGRWTAPVLDADPDAPVPWVASGYVAGPALHRAVAAHGPLPEHTVRALGAGLAEALAAIHAQALVHRDVKPSNVLLGADGPRLIDFGIVRAADASATFTTTGVALGSPGYMSPEQVLARQVGPASDVFSLGAVLAYAATGTGPFPGDSSAALLYKVVHEEPELDGVPAGLRRLCADCLAKNPVDRPTPAEVVRRLAGEREPAALLTADWLPTPVLAEAHRSAAELLDLEVAEPAPPPAPTAPPPAPATPASTPGAAPDTATSPATPGDVATWRLAPPAAPPANPSASPPAPSGATPPPTPAPGDLPTAGGERPTPWHEASTVDSGAPPRRSRAALRAGLRGRRLSCTVVVAVAGALAAVTALTGWPELLPGTGHPDSSPVGSPPADRTEQPVTVPQAFVGTFTGDISAGTLPAGRLTVTVEPGRRGEDVARLLYTLPFHLRCYGVGRLTAVDGDRLTVTERPDPDKETVSQTCTNATATVTLTLEGRDRLHYRSFDDHAGRPTGLLTRVE